MENWYSKAFSAAIKRAAKENIFKLPPKEHRKYRSTDFTNEDIYQYLSKEIHVDASTIKKWGDRNSSGPQSERTAIELEKLLKAKLFKREYSNQYELPYKAAVSGLYTILSAFCDTIEENRSILSQDEDVLSHTVDYLFMSMELKKQDLPDKVYAIICGFAVNIINTVIDPIPSSVEKIIAEYFNAAKTTDKTYITPNINISQDMSAALDDFFTNIANEFYLLGRNDQ